MLRFEVPEPNKKINFQLTADNKRLLRRMQDVIEESDGVAPSFAFLINWCISQHGDPKTAAVRVLLDQSAMRGRKK